MMKYIGFFITIVCMFFMLTVPVALRAQTRRALVIGIGQQEDKDWGKINGDKDVPFVEEMLGNADFEEGKMTERVRNMVSVLVPLIVSAMRRADDLALAMDARCYHGGEGRTKMKPLMYMARDYVGYAVICIYLTVAITAGIII